MKTQTSTAVDGTASAVENIDETAMKMEQMRLTIERLRTRQKKIGHGLTTLLNTLDGSPPRTGPRTTIPMNDPSRS